MYTSNIAFELGLHFYWYIFMLCLVVVILYAFVIVCVSVKRSVTFACAIYEYIIDILIVNRQRGNAGGAAKIAKPVQHCNTK